MSNATQLTKLGAIQQRDAALDDPIPLEHWRGFKSEEKYGLQLLRDRRWLLRVVETLVAQIESQECDGASALCCSMRGVVDPLCTRCTALALLTAPDEARP